MECLQTDQPKPETKAGSVPSPESMIECPGCGGRMLHDARQKAWECADCGYQI